MTRTDILRLLSLLLTAIVLSAGLAHLYELPNKIRLSREEYLVVQQIYRGWSLFGIAIFGALASIAALAAAVRGHASAFRRTVSAGGCIVLGLAVFFLFIYPVNRQTLDWTVSPENWRELRRQWEYAHAVNAGLYLAAFVALALSLMTGPEKPPGG